MKQYKNKKAMALLMAAVLAGSALYSGVADAASAIKLNKKTAKIAVGKSVTLKVRGTKKKVKALYFILHIAFYVYFCQ